HRRLQQIRYLLCCSDCYRVERSSSRVGLSPTVVQRLSRRTVIAGWAVICPQLHEAIYRDLRQASSDRPNHPSFSQSSRHTLFLNV
ncbi:MAG TPA: hypothetical protein VGM27_30900, partial [Acidobacteriaceae bacterium]